MLKKSFGDYPVARLQVVFFWNAKQLPSLCIQADLPLLLPTVKGSFTLDGLVVYVKCMVHVY